jgi:hypothetical protein
LKGGKSLGSGVSNPFNCTQPLFPELRFWTLTKISKEIKIHVVTLSKEWIQGLGMVADTCNPSSMRNRDWEDG